MRPRYRAVARVPLTRSGIAFIALLAALVIPGAVVAQTSGDDSTLTEPEDGSVQGSPDTVSAAQAGFFRTETAGSNSWHLVITAPGALRVSVQARTIPGDVLRVFGPDGGLVGESAVPDLADEEVSLQAPGPGTYQVRVEGGQGGHNAFHLVVSGAAGAAATVPPADVPQSDGSVPALIGPNAPFLSTPSLAIVGISPPAGTLVARPLAGLQQALRGTPGPVQPPGGQVTADVSYDTGGKLLFVVGLMDRGDQPAPIAAGLDAGAGRDAAFSIEPVSGVGVAHLIAGTAGLFTISGVKATRLRVRLCEPPADGPNGLAQIGQCYVEVVSGDYSVQQE